MQSDNPETIISHAVVVFTSKPAAYVCNEVADTESVVLREELIGIGEIRHVTTEANRRPSEGFARKQITVTAQGITVEAQQAALKILEDTPENVSIMLVLPSGTQLLPTIRSRVQIREISAEVADTVFKDWLAEPYAERMREIESHIKAKDIAWQQSIKSGLLQHLQENDLPVAELQALELVARNLLTRGAANKMLLEQAALSLPLTT